MRNWLEVQSELGVFLQANAEKINNYNSERALLQHLDKDDPFRLQCEIEIDAKFGDMLRKRAALNREREMAYHEQKRLDPKKLTKTKGHNRAMLDLNHPNNPHGIRLDRPEEWKPGQYYGPGGQLQERKVILLPK